MKQSEIKEKTTQELLEGLEEQRISYNKMKLAHVVSPLENPLQLKTTRKSIARILTELKRRELEETA